MKDNFKNLITRLTNVGTIIGLASAIIFILQSAGIVFDADKVGNIVRGVCAVGMFLGILNNSETKGVYIPFVYRFEDKQKELENESGIMFPSKEE